MGIRCTAAVPLITALIAMVLLIVLLVSGSSPSTANANFWLALNLSGTGQNLIQIETVQGSDAGAGGNIISGLTSIIPGLDGVMQNITGGIESGIDGAVSQLIAGLTSSLGIQDMYILYAFKVCGGNFRDNAPPTMANLNITDCVAYADPKADIGTVTNKIPSSLTIGNVRVKITLLDTLKSVLKLMGDLIRGLGTTIAVFLILGTISSAFTAFGSLAGLFASESRLVTRFNLTFSLLGMTVTVLTAFVMSIALALISAIGPSLEDAIGMRLTGSSQASFLAILWSAAVMTLVMGSYWFIVWFVEFRTSAFSRRSRDRDEIGNYFGVVAEVIADFKVDGHVQSSSGRTFGKA